MLEMPNALITIEDEQQRPARVMVRLAGGFTPGKPLDRSVDDEYAVPSDIIDEGEEMYRILERGTAGFELSAGNLLIVDPRPDGDASTGELVLAEHRGRVYVGRWWSKHGRRALLDERYHTILDEEELHVLSAVTLIAQPD